MLLYTRHLIINFFETFVEKSCFDFELCVLRSFDPLDPASLQMTFFTTQVNTILWLRKVLTSKELVTKRCYIHLQLPMSTTKDIWNRFTDQGTPPSKKQKRINSWAGSLPQNLKLQKDVPIFSPIGILVQQIAQWDAAGKAIMWFVGWSLCVWLIVNLVKLKR